MEAATQTLASEGTPRASFLLRALSDKTLTKLAANGSDEAFSTLYERHQGAVFAYCVSILRDYAEAEDALAEVMLRTHQALQGSDRDIAFKPWLFRCARNHCLNLLQRRAVRDNALHDLHEESERVDQVFERNEELKEVLSDVAELPEEQRNALLMREASGLSHIDIADALDIDPARAKRLLFEARRALHSGVEGRAMACAEVRFELSDGDGRTTRRRDIRSHLKSCQSCRDFESSLSERRAVLSAGLPILGPEVGLVVLAKIFGTASTAHAAAGSAAAVGTTGAGAAASATGAAAAGHSGGVVGTLAGKFAAAGLVAKGATVIAVGTLVTAGGMASSTKIDNPDGSRANEAVAVGSTTAELFGLGRPSSALNDLGGLVATAGGALSGGAGLPDNTASEGGGSISGRPPPGNDNGVNPAPSSSDGKGTSEKKDESSSQPRKDSQSDGRSNPSRDSDTKTELPPALDPAPPPSPPPPPDEGNTGPDSGARNGEPRQPPQQQPGASAPQCIDPDGKLVPC